MKNENKFEILKISDQANQVKTWFLYDPFEYEHQCQDDCIHQFLNAVLTHPYSIYKLIDKTYPSSVMMSLSKSNLIADMMPKAELLLTQGYEDYLKTKDDQTYISVLKTYLKHHQMFEDKNQYSAIATDFLKSLTKTNYQEKIQGFIKQYHTKNYREFNPLNTYIDFAVAHSYRFITNEANFKYKTGYKSFIDLKPKKGLEEVYKRMVKQAIEQEYWIYLLYLDHQQTIHVCYLDMQIYRHRETGLILGDKQYQVKTTNFHDFIKEVCENETINLDNVMIQESFLKDLDYLKEINQIKLNPPPTLTNNRPNLTRLIVADLNHLGHQVNMTYQKDWNKKDSKKTVSSIGSTI